MRRIECKSYYNGSGKVILGYGDGVVCTEIVEKVANCPDCRGNGFIAQTANVKVN